jgi:hypothetical protein
MQFESLGELRLRHPSTDAELLDSKTEDRLVLYEELPV